MSVSNEPQVAEEAVARLLRATRANDAEAAPTRHPRQTDQCPTIARFAAVILSNPDRTQQEAWTQEEARHTRGCAFCQDMFRWFRDAKLAATAPPPVVDASDETVTNLDTSEETQTGLTAPETKKPDSAPRPASQKKPDDPPTPPARRAGE